MAHRETPGAGNVGGGDAGAGDDLVALRLAATSTAISRQAHRVRAGDPGSVHDMRVAIRRARSCLRTFRLLLDRSREETLRDDLGWLATTLGRARDPEVLARRLGRRLDRIDVAERMGPVRRDLVGRCRSAAEGGRAAVIEELESERYDRLVDALATFAADPPYRRGASGADPAALRHCVRKELDRVLRRIDRAEAAPNGLARDLGFHQVRKAAKRVRYAAETIAPLDPKAARRLARHYEEVQDLLGERQDAAVARRLLVEEGARVGVQPAHNGFTYGVLAEQERAAIRAVEDRWTAARRRATRRTLRRFLKR